MHLKKKLEKFIEVTEHPLIIVGEKLGRQRLGEDVFALEGNNTGDFVHEAIGDETNIILTNLVNYYYDGPLKKDHLLTEGLYDLKNLFETWKPSKVITLGSPATMYVQSLQVDGYLPTDCPIWDMPHPSYIRRFYHSDLLSWKQKLSYEIKQRVPANSGLG